MKPYLKTIAIFIGIVLGVTLLAPLFVSFVVIGLPMLAGGLYLGWFFRGITEGKKKNDKAGI